MSKKDSFKKGDRVSAKWSGSNVFYDAKILDVTSRTYKVQFDDGSVSSVKLSEVKKLASSKEPSPKTSKSQSRSRSRSTGRATRSRSRSPARREKKKSGTTKKEPKSSAKEKESKVKSSDNSPNTNSNSKKGEVDKKNRDKVLEMLKEEEASRRSPVVTLNSYTKESSSTSEKFQASTERVRSTRLAALRAAEATRDALISETRRSDELRNAKLPKGKYSDDEEEQEDEVDMPPRVTSNTMKAFYFLATVFRIIFLPSVVLFFVFACTRKQCKVLDIPQFYARWRDMANAMKFPIMGIFFYHLLHCLLPLVPLGRKVIGFSFETKKSAMEYRLNGFLVLMVNIVVFSLAAYFGVYLNWGFDKFKGIALSCVLYAIIWALGLHIYSLIKGNSTTETKIPFLGKFYNGSYINPTLFGKIDIKTSFIRAGLMGVVLINMSIVLKYVLMKGTIAVPLAMTAGMQTFFVLDMFIREEKFLSSATYTTDTVGYSFILTQGFLVPIGLTFQTIYLFLFESKAAYTPHYCSAAILGLFFFGYYIYLTSTNLKHNFRRNPFSPALSNIVSIPTSRKKRLIASGLWGLVRHPNYLGLFIMATAWSLPCGFSHILPCGPLLLLAIALIVRCFRIELECKEKYGPAWKNYCEKARSRLIPYVF